MRKFEQLPEYGRRVNVVEQPSELTDAERDSVRNLERLAGVRGAARYLQCSIDTINSACWAIRKKMRVQTVVKLRRTIGPGAFLAPGGDA
jgi:DNA-binding CsgD family transcriptional regulator